MPLFTEMAESIRAFDSVNVGFVELVVVVRPDFKDVPCPIHHAGNRDQDYSIVVNI
jgi:hypothetical protein